MQNTAWRPNRNVVRQDLCRILLVLKPRPMKRLVASMMLMATSCVGVFGQECSQNVNIPDMVGWPFVWFFDVAEASPGQVIQDANSEIDHLFVNMEHSYMGDLTITFICPSGQSVVVQELAGGGAFLGEPIDNDGESCAGVGYDYFWSPNATNGTWAESNTSGNTTLPSGTYESVQSIENLNGCVVEGSWQIQIMDSYGGDNGHLFEYGVTLTVVGCTDPAACNFDAAATEDDGSCAELDACGVCGGSCTSDINNNGVDDEEEVPGCTYAFAENYNPDATDDDGTCLLPNGEGCNTTCLEGTVYDEALEGCVPEVQPCGFASDLDNDGAVGASDLLSLLTEYGLGIVDVDSDGVCDEIDDCVGAYDECGVCNGPGALYECGCEECVEYVDCGDPVSYQGYDYATVLIGEQCWFAENLRSENYLNGDAIPSGLSDNGWAFTISGAVAVYGEDAGCNDDSPDIDACDPAQSLNEYGRLYNWYAVDDVRGLCPNGWHVPTDAEWTLMTNFLGDAYTAGPQMKTDYGWYEGGNGTNSSGFSALPGGHRTDGGYFNSAGIGGSWWSSTLDGFYATPDGYAWARGLSAAYNTLVRGNYGAYTNSGYSVRCLRDAE